MTHHISNQIEAAAKLIWDYHHLHHQLRKADAIFILCSLDTTVAERAAELYALGYGNTVIVSGGFSPLTKQLFQKSEAETFKDILLAKGVPETAIIIENKSTNTGENIRFSFDLLRAMNLHYDSFILVQKPFMERRTYATFKKQWPDQDTDIIVTSPIVSFEEYLRQAADKKVVLNSMASDLYKLKAYPAQGFQIEQTIPNDVWRAYELLTAAGYGNQAN